MRRTRKEVVQALRELIREQERGVDLRKRIPTTREYFEQWFERDYTPKRRNKPNSINTYRNIIYNHIIPAIGHIRLNKLARRHMTDMLNAMSERDYAFSTIKLVRRVLIQGLSRAERDELIARNYGKDTELPHARQAQGYDVVQISRILGHAKVSTTIDIYTHLFDEDIAYVADTIDTLMNTDKTGES